jgi:D-xylose 1-dehydrogenase (NADP+, D-xylono-1,5-lactone-forming)
MSRTDNPLRWGIVGTGNIARQFAEGVAASRRGLIVAVASRSADAARTFAQTYHIPRSHAGYDAILNDREVDAIYLSLPNSMHHEWTIRCLRAGKHVLCEKPLATSADQAMEMFDVAKQTGKLLVEAFMYRAHPQTAKLVDIVQGGDIGNLKLIRTSFCFRVRSWQNNIRFKPELAGGALMDVGCYCVSLSRLLAGSQPTDVRAVATLHETGVDEQTTVSMKFPNGITAEFTCGMMLQTDNSALICGDEGYLVAGWPWKPAPPKSTIELRRSIPPRQDNPAVKPTLPPTQMIDVSNDQPLYAIEADAFARAVAGEVAPFVSETESIDNARTLHDIRRQIGLSY